jgi:hypothetical protein
LGWLGVLRVVRIHHTPKYTLPEKARNAVQAYLFEGHVIIERMVTREMGRMVHIPDGMVHHWLAIGFIPGVTRDQAIAVAQTMPATQNCTHRKCNARKFCRGSANALRCIAGFTGMRSFLGLSRSVPPGFDQELQKHLHAFVDN